MRKVHCIRKVGSVTQPTISDVKKVIVLLLRKTLWVPLFFLFILKKSLTITQKLDTQIIVLSDFPLKNINYFSLRFTSSTASTLLGAKSTGYSADALYRGIVIGTRAIASGSKSRNLPAVKYGRYT